MKAFRSGSNPGRRSGRLFLMISRYEFVNFPVPIRHLQLSANGGESTPVAVHLKATESSAKETDFTKNE
jgi:hypothetical protein